MKRTLPYTDFLSPFQDASSLNSANITLSAPIPDSKVKGSYKQFIRANDHKLIFQTSNYDTRNGIRVFNKTGANKFVSIPVDDWLASNLTFIERFVMTNVTIPDDAPKAKEGSQGFKSLLAQKEAINITISKWCKYFKFDDDKGIYVPVEDLSAFEKGFYNVNIEASHVYIGPHKDGQNYSLSLFVTQILYKEVATEVEMEMERAFEIMMPVGPMEPESGKKRKKKPSALRRMKPLKISTTL